MACDDPQTSLWRRDESLRLAGARLAEQPPGIRVVSFDFFDTLVSRLCADPADLFIEAGRQLARRGLLRQPLTPSEFRAARIAADERARRKATRGGRSNEVRLDDIYRELGNVLTDPSAARAVEFELERACCYLNPAVASFVRYARSLGCKTAIVSDTYFTAAELVQLLGDHGLSASLFDHIFVSCECGKAKWNSQLYHEVFRRYDLHPHELMHIGDNVHADVHCAGQLGVETVHYYRTTPNQDAIFAGERSLGGANTYPAGALNSLRVMTARASESDEDAFRDGAMVFGPVLSRYADWCVERLRANGVRKVLALMREGELLGQLVRRAADAAGADFTVIPCYASRMATARAALPETNLENVLELLEGSGSLTAQAILEIVGLGAEAAKFLSPEIRFKPLTSGESIYGVVKLLFDLPGLHQRIEARRLESHKLAFDYLNSLVGEETRIGVIDLGWSGSIQRNVARILRLGGREVQTVGCYVACTRRAGRLALEGDSASAYMESEWDRSAILAEVAITAPVGSTDGYRRDDSGRVVPVLGSYEITPAERAAKERLREGMFAFQARWLELRHAQGRVPLSPEMIADLDRQSAAILYRLMDFPTKPEAERLGVLRHDENYFGQNLSAPLCNDEATRRLRREGAHSLFADVRCYWPQGVIARNHPRLVSALRARWNDPLALGRWGVWHGPAPADAGVTDEELFSLGALLRGFAPEQVVFCGALTPALAEIFPALWSSENSSEPATSAKSRLLVADTLGNRADASAPQPFDAASLAKLLQGARISGNLAAVETIRSIQAQLAVQGDLALVLTSDVPGATARLLLNGLAPFLGPRGVVLVACGRFDRFTFGEEVPLVRRVNQWFKDTGMELGFGLWTKADDKSHLCNWVAFRRDPEAIFWNRQWMPTIADLAYSA